MAKDAQGHELTGASAKAAELFDAAVRAYTLNYGDTNAILAKAEADSPDCAMAAILRGWLLAVSNDPGFVAQARNQLAELDGAGMNEREQALLKAARHTAEGRWQSATVVLDRHLMDYPHDLVGLQSALRIDNFQGRFHQAATRGARALPFWSDNQPGYGIMLSFYGFGLEEAGDYAKAEAMLREAAALEPYGYWPHHGVSHVLEMTGRPDEGIDWMESRETFWDTPENANRVHIWWHKSLYHVELGQYDRALAIYDNEVAQYVRPVGTSMCNPTALLWRLETLGCEPGDRWAPVFARWQDKANGRTSPFNDVHYAMTALRAGERVAYDSHLAVMRETAANGTELAPAYGMLAVPVAEAMADFTEGHYAEAGERLLSVRGDLARLGGSIAQRDLVDWTLTVAASRAGLSGVARSMANERLAVRPDSAVNRRFLEDARAIAV